MNYKNKNEQITRISYFTTSHLILIIYINNLDSDWSTIYIPRNYYQIVNTREGHAPL